MTEQNFVYVDTNYLKELEETAKKVDYYKGIIDGINMVIDRKTEPTHDLRTETHECVKDTHDKTEPQYSEDDMYWLSLAEDVANGKMSDAGANQAWLEYINRKDEPTISKMEQVDKDINVRSKDEPQPSKIIEAYAKGFEDGADAVKSIPRTERLCNNCEYYGGGEVCDHPSIGEVEMGGKGDTFPWIKETPKWCPLKDEPQTYKPTCNGECRNCEYRAKDGNYCMKTDCPWK